MHIIFVTTELSTKNNASGGLATFTANIARIFYSNGHKIEVFLVTTKEQDIKFDEGIVLRNIYIDKSDWNEYDFISRLYYPEDEEKAALNRRELIKVRKAELVRQEIEEINKIDKVDIVHFCNHGAFSMMMNPDIPYVIRISGYLNILFGGANTPNGSIEYADNLPGINDQYEIHAMQKAKHVIAPSKLLADIGRKNIGINPVVLESPFVLLQSGLDYSIFENELKDKKYILFFGGLRYLKGIQVIADIAERFLKEYSDMCLVLSGYNYELRDDNGSIMMAADYVKSKAGDFSDRVLYMGRLVREQLYPIIKNAELCLLPSRIENLPNACIEALSFGKIVVATNGASYEQLIDNRISGFLCERDNPESYLEAINEALNMNAEEKEKMSARALEVTKRLEPQRIYCQYLDFYEKVIREW